MTTLETRRQIHQLARQMETVLLAAISNNEAPGARHARGPRVVYKARGLAPKSLQARARQVWEALKAKGPMTAPDLERAAKLGPNAVKGAIWRLKEADLLTTLGVTDQLAKAS